MNITQAIAEVARQQPEAPAIVLGGNSLSHSEADAAIARLAGFFAAGGVSRGDVVGISMPTSPLHLLSILAVAHLGAVSISLPPGSPNSRERGALARRYSVMRIVSDRADSGVRGIGHQEIRPRWRTEAGAPSAPRAAVAADTPWRIFLSSGTTGTQKAMRYAHGDLIEGTRNWKGVAPPIGKGTRILCLRGLDTGFMLRSCLRQLLGGGAVEFARSTSLESMIKAFRRGEVTHAVVPPPALRSLCELLGEGGPFFPGLIHLAVGGATSSPALIALAQARVTPHIYSQYGASETSIVAIAGPELLRHRPESAGKVVPWLEAQAVDENDHALAAGESGVLRFRGPGVATEYYLDPEATARSFRHGWFYPGDTGRIDPDGLLFIEGRADDRINIGGIKFDPGEIERVLERHPQVVEAGVFTLPVAHGDPVLCAAVVLRAPLAARVLTEHCRNALKPDKQPSRFISLRKLPRNENGKLLRRELQQVGKARALAAAGNARK